MTVTRERIEECRRLNARGGINEYRAENDEILSLALAQVDAAANRETSVDIDAIEAKLAAKCPECAGTGEMQEDHGNGAIETLSCFACCGLGHPVIPESEAMPFLRALIASVRHLEFEHAEAMEIARQVSKGEHDARDRAKAAEAKLACGDTGKMSGACGECLQCMTLHAEFTGTLLKQAEAKLAEVERERDGLHGMYLANLTRAEQAEAAAKKARETAEGFGSALDHRAATIAKHEATIASLERSLLDATRRAEQAERERDARPDGITQEDAAAWSKPLHLRRGPDSASATKGAAGRRIRDALRAHAARTEVPRG